MRVVQGISIALLFMACENNTSNAEVIEEARTSNAGNHVGQFTLADEEKSYVIIPWNGRSGESLNVSDSLTQYSDFSKDLRGDIKRVNNASGDEGLKLSSLLISSNGTFDVFVIRSFETLQDARTYSQMLQEKLDKEVLQRISFVVPVNYSDYKTSIELKSFEPYHARYTKSQNRLSPIK